jgi:Cu(I)/Ag(I) efflux system periplasmic protein CusF
MKTILSTSLLVLAAVLGSSVGAQQNKVTSSVAAPAAKATLSDGEVRKVDKAGATITLKHGEIKNLNMGPMSMMFKAKDPALLDKVKAGDKVKFTALEINGELTLMTIEKAR